MTRLPAVRLPFAGEGLLSLDRDKNLSYPKAAMKHLSLSRAVYIFLLLCEIIKIALLSGEALPAAGGLDIPAVFAHVAMAALCLPPAMLFMLAARERAFSFCLPLLAIEKGLSLLSAAFLVARALNSLSFAAQQVSSFGLAFCAIMLCVAGDLASFIFCLWRRKKLCG